MKYFKRFNERIEENDLDDVLDILHYVGDTTPKIWMDDLSVGVAVVYFEDCYSKPEIKEIEDCQSRLMSNGYRLISYDVDETGLWFLVMTKELESIYKDKLLFKFIEDLDFKRNSKFDFIESVINFNGDQIFVEFRNGDGWTIWDSITDSEEYEDENKVLSNISLLKTQHKMRGIQRSLSTPPYKKDAEI